MKIEASGVAPSQIEDRWSKRPVANPIISSVSQDIASDRTTLRSDASTIKSLVSQALATPDVRQDKVQQLRQAVQSGAYKVDTHTLATAITADSAE